MSNQSKPILCLDFDGVLHSYSSGWQGASVIPDEPVPGALDFLTKALRHFSVAIYSSRSSQPFGIEAMKFWLGVQFAKQGMETSELMAIMKEISFPSEKPPAFLTIDDRAITFTGQWPVVEELLLFKPWNKQ